MCDETNVPDAGQPLDETYVPAEKESGDLAGWLRLARARMVLGEREAAEAALRTAEHHFSGDADSLRRIAETRDALGLGQGGDKTSP